MTRWALLPAVFLLGACENGLAIPDFRSAFSGAADAAPAPTLQLSDKERFVGAIAANGCLINPTNVGPVLQQASISADQSAVLLTELVDEGTLVEGEPGSDTLRLIPASCPSLDPAL